MRTALIVEGSVAYGTGRRGDPLTEIWEMLCRDYAGIDEFDVVVGLSKDQLVAMAPGNSTLSTMREPFDVYLERLIRQHGLEAAVVAWDLQPAWSAGTANCRWRETLELYSGLALSQVIPDLWRGQAQLRLAQLQGRVLPSARTQPASLGPGMVLPLCMEVMFESLLTDESVVRSALGLHGQRVPGWPSGWSPNHPGPDKGLLGPATSAVRRLRPQHPAARAVRRDWFSGKNDWAEYILRQVKDDPALRAVVASHPIVRRLREVGPNASSGR